MSKGLRPGNIIWHEVDNIKGIGDVYCIRCQSMEWIKTAQDSFWLSHVSTVMTWYQARMVIFDQLNYRQLRNKDWAPVLKYREILSLFH
jgi:hypothetical protein